MIRLTWQDPAHISRTYSVLWNAVVRFLQIGLQFVFVPVYLSLLGSDAFALLVLNATVMATLAFIDQFVSAIMLRELGTHNGNRDQTAKLWSLFFWLERVSLATALVIICLAPFVGPLLVSQWSTENALDARVLGIATALMGLSIGVQLPGMFYAAGLVGLQRQRLLSTIRLVWLPAYYGIGGLLLFLVERNVILLLGWQALAFAVLSLVLRFVVKRTMLPAPSNTSGGITVLRHVWQFGFASLVFAITTIAVTQIDKFIVATHTPSPERFAAYGLAFSLAAQTLAALSGAFFTAVQPALTGLHGNSERAALVQAYGRWTQIIMMVTVLCAGMMFVVLSPLVDIWLGANSPLGPHIKQLVPIILAATVLNASVITPLILMFAAERLLAINALNLVAVVSALIFLPESLQRWGLVSGAVYFLLVNAAYLLIAAPAIHRAVFGHGYAIWLLRDIALPVAVGALVFIGADHWAGQQLSFIEASLLAAASSTLCLCLMLILMPEARKQIGAITRFMLTSNKTINP
jgi:O-antigen/teichoic acid export membrane protein